jgi:hypothetical protein
METRIILTVLCFTMSFLSLVRGYFLIKAEQQEQNSGALINVSDTVNSLKLVFFNGIKSRNGIVLMWMANSQTVKYGFDIERKEADGTYTSLTHIENVKEGRTYKFIDRNENNNSEYRLKQTDLLGVNYYSNTVQVNEC